MKILQSLTAVWLLCGSALGAAAGELVFTVDNEFTEDLAIAFYSAERDQVWPGGDQVWIIGMSDGEISYPLDCNQGELICYGAWSQGGQDQWGLGMDMSQDCSDCCARCGDVLDEVIILN